MKVSTDVYTKDVNAALEAFKHAVEAGATDVQLHSSKICETTAFQDVNFMFEADHSSSAIVNLDNGPFVKDTDDL